MGGATEGRRSRRAAQRAAAASSAAIPRTRGDAAPPVGAAAAGAGDGDAGIAETAAGVGGGARGVGDGGDLGGCGCGGVGDSVGGANEVIFDANWVRRRLPSSIEAFFTVRPAFANKRCKSWCDALVRVASKEGWEASRCAAAASGGGDQCDAYIRDVHRRWTVEYGANAAPLLIFDLGNWSAPFSVAQ